MKSSRRDSIFKHSLRRSMELHCEYQLVSKMNGRGEKRNKLNNGNESKARSLTRWLVDLIWVIVIIH